MISCGVALASQGELRFNIIGFFTQAAAVAVSVLITAILMQIIDHRHEHICLMT